MLWKRRRYWRNMGRSWDPQGWSGHVQFLHHEHEQRDVMLQWFPRTKRVSKFYATSRVEEVSWYVCWALLATTVHTAKGLLSIISCVRNVSLFNNINSNKLFPVITGNIISTQTFLFSCAKLFIWAPQPTPPLTSRAMKTMTFPNIFRRFGEIR